MALELSLFYVEGVFKHHEAHLMHDHDYVNFAQEHELNYILRKFDKRPTQDNRARLMKWNREFKAGTGRPKL